MSWEGDKYTKVIKGNVHIEIDGPDETIDLMKYANEQCKKLGCSGDWTIETGLECDCVVAIMYWNTVKLAAYEQVGTLKEVREMKKEIERLKPLAVLGQMALGIFDSTQHKICVERGYDKHCNKHCAWLEFCRKRAELNQSKSTSLEGDEIREDNC